MNVHWTYVWIGIILFLILIIGQFSSCLMDVSPYWDAMSDKAKNP
ncbi:MAG: hypothetical protein ACPGII_02675 [Opitutales bacterium]|jgi:hypothetical protein